MYKERPIPKHTIIKSCNTAGKEVLTFRGKYIHQRNKFYLKLLNINTVSLRTLEQFLQNSEEK